jgi:CarD family transcriptional regulator
MNFDSQSGTNYSNSAQSSATPTDQANEIQSGEARFGFKATDLIVYPAHGVGQIIAIQEQTVAGVCLEFFVVYFAKSKMTLRVPTRKAADSGLRKLSDPSAIRHIRRILGQPAHRSRGNWPRLSQEYDSKINSGNILAVAEVVRDLHRRSLNPDQSFSERQLYTAAIDRLSAEVALVCGITEDEAVREFESLMTPEVRHSA